MPSRKGKAPIILENFPSVNPSVGTRVRTNRIIAFGVVLERPGLGKEKSESPAEEPNVFVDVLFCKGEIQAKVRCNAIYKEGRCAKEQAFFVVSIRS